MRAWRASGSSPRAAPTPRGISSPPPPTCRPRPSSASAPPSASGTGSAGAIRCGPPSGCRSRWRSGRSTFVRLLAGAHAMDDHFAQAPLEKNLPVLLGVLDVWYRNFHGFTSRSVAPYHQGLKRLPAYLQQLEMECNGKRVDLDGPAAALRHLPVVWGEPGTNGQHAYFQMLHQGTDVIPVEFIAGQAPDASACRPAREGAGQRPGPGPGADAGQDHGGGATRGGAHRLEVARCGDHCAASHLPGQPAEHDPRAGSPDAACARRADRALRAPRVHQRRAVGHQQLRPVGRGARQGAVQ